MQSSMRQIIRERMKRLKGEDNYMYKKVNLFHFFLFIVAYIDPEPHP